MAVDIEKILTISAREWFEMNEKKPSKYEARGVHHIGVMASSALSDFAEKVPTEAEVVVGYRSTSATSGASGGMSAMTYYYGTALIPRKSFPY